MEVCSNSLRGVELLLLPLLTHQHLLYLSGGGLCLFLLLADWQTLIFLKACSLKRAPGLLLLHISSPMAYTLLCPCQVSSSLPSMTLFPHFLPCIHPNSLWYSGVSIWTLHLVIFFQGVCNCDILNSTLLWIQTKPKDPSHKLHICQPNCCCCFLLNTPLLSLLFYWTSETIWSLSIKCT